MGVFSRFGGLINLNTQQPLKAESKRSKNVKSKSSESEMDTNHTHPKKKLYYDEAEERKQENLWSEAEKKHKWYDAPPKVKVTTTEKGVCHMSIEMTVGHSPYSVFELLTNPNNIWFFEMGDGRELMKNKSRKVLNEDGPLLIVKTEKYLAWDFLLWSGYLPISLIVDENKKDLIAQYKKKEFMFMKVFEGNYKVEPIFVDSERLCNRLPKTREQYKKCSGGQGKIASKVIMNQYFQPCFPFDLPPFSWYIRGVTIKTTETLLKMLQGRSAFLRE